MNLNGRSNSNNDGPLFLSAPLPNGENGLRCETTVTKNDTPSNKLNRTPTPADSGWAPIHKIHKLSYYHPLEPTHTTFSRNSIVQVLDRLTNSLRMLSCHVVWYDDEHMAASCTTMDANVKFQMNIFASRMEHDDLVLELQRLAGDSFVFHKQYAQPLLSAVHSKEPYHITTVEDPRTVTEFPESMDQCMNDHDNQVVNVDDQDIYTALRLAEEMIQCNGWDVRRMGIETLLTFTDPSNAGLETTTASVRILISDLPDLIQQVESLVLCDHEYLTLTALKVCCQIWQTPTAMTTSHDNVPTFLIQRLAHFVRHVHVAPHHATLALQGLTALGKAGSCISGFTSLPAPPHAAWENARRQAATAVQG